MEHEIWEIETTTHHHSKRTNLHVADSATNSNSTSPLAQRNKTHKQNKQRPLINSLNQNQTKTSNDELKRKQTDISKHANDYEQSSHRNERKTYNQDDLNIYLSTWKVFLRRLKLRIGNYRTPLIIFVTEKKPYKEKPKRPVGQTIRELD